MNRNKYLLGALGVVALVLVGTYVLFNRGNNNNNSESVADATGSEVQTEGTDSESVGQPTSVPNTTDEAVEVADLPALPAIGASDQATGLGGGGVSARLWVAAVAVLKARLLPPMAASSSPIRFQELFLR